MLQALVFTLSTILCEEKEREREREREREGKEKEKSARSPDQGSTAQRLLISSWVPGYKAQIKSWPLIRVVLLCTV